VPTRRRILFVESDAKVRDVLQRLVRPMEDRWDVSFGTDGRSALAALAREPFEVLVTAVALPDLSGSELLVQVQNAHPKTARMVLAPLAAQPQVMACSRLLHQFLAWPVELEALSSAVERACDVEHALRREQIGRLVGRMDRLPSLPDLYHKMVEKMADPECSIDEIGDLIARDISMTARILKLVNSAFFGLRHRVSNPHEAVNYIGLDTVKALVLSINAFAQFEHVALGGITLEVLWNHSLLVGAHAKRIAHLEGAHARVLDETFVAGMLHDTGKLALGANFGPQYAAAVAAVSSAGSLLAAEEAAFGATHAEVGGYLLGLWGLPEPIVDAVAWHHQPRGCPEARFGPLACVHAADVWAHAEDKTGSGPSIDRAYFDELGLHDRVADWHRACLEATAAGVAV
jgi:HD-like signal output (HDOD) protein